MGDSHNRYLDELLAKELCPSPAVFHQWLARRRGALQRRVTVDLGSGSGGFLLAEANRNREALFVGFEMRLKRLVRSAKKLEQAGLENACAVYADGTRLGEFFPPCSVDVALLQFPDPWPKVRHRQRRLLSSKRLRWSLERVCKPGGIFALRTDSSSCFLHALRTIGNWHGWQTTFFSNHTARDGFPPSQTITEFQQLFQSQKRAVYSLVLCWQTPVTKTILS